LLRPYDAPADRRDWFKDPQLSDRLAARLAAFPYRGIGEFHVFGENASTPAMAAMIRMAIERGLFLHAHADRDAIERLLAQADGLTVIWAHAGFDVPTTELAELLERQPNLLLELSYRNDIAPGGQLDPRWRALFIAHPERFLVGMDTHVDDRWDALGELAQETRQWLDQLPAAVARRIAFDNAAALAGPP
jgi:predicted TIM-barrel fold metal-dependent hydrolase